MPTKILMPALSPTMEKGNLTKWLKQEGDTIKSGDVIAEIETDKATMEVEAVDEGILAKIVVAAGTEDVAVNALIGLIAEEGEDVKEVAASGGAGASPAPATAAPASVASVAAPVAEAAPATAKPSPPRADGSRIFASPLARRLAKEANLDLAKISGTGPHGRIVERDVEQAKAGGTATAAPAASASRAPVPMGMADDMVRKLFQPGTFEEIPHDTMRKTIARRLVEAKSTVPHFYLTLDCDIGPLLAARVQINNAAPKNKEGKPAYKVSVNDFVIKALAMALQRVPDANVSWTEAAMLKHTHSDIGVAVSIPGGLITPVVRKAETKGLAMISNEMKDYATRARGRKLKPEEYQGGSSAVSNLGMFGIKNFSAVINPPHATILAVGAGEERVVVRGGKMEVANMMSVTLSTDHRAVDGALGAELL
ncbi:MAG: pyruvate dehydrogenase complex dihydrolipoamide acetyltransferase, partial [Beijerinckiaceae bacterium]|nr:pyruvate dehydrogenase complex dihydrolipoamide acetyltransferase [Beijerinckiaceae bacterium]